VEALDLPVEDDYPKSAWDVADRVDYSDEPCWSCGATDHHTYGHGGLVVRADWDGQAPFPFTRPFSLADDLVAHALAYTLTQAEQDAAWKCARDQADASTGLKDAWGRKALSPDEKLANDALGNSGEIAFARLVGLPWKCSLGKYRGARDVGPYQVRTASESWHRLIVHETDRGRPVVLMTGRGPTFRLAGWMKDADLGMKREYLADPGARRLAWFVPRSILADPRTLPELAAKAVVSP
jgi:hypothetical protein